MASKFLDYNLPQNAYVAFDAVTLKDYIINQLNQNEKFTDQNYEGSNLAGIIDIVAFSYHVLLFYLNNTAAESQFSQTQLYENMNRIVGLIGYKPVGKQTSQLALNATATANLAVGNYTIRKYSYLLVDGIQYTFNRDYNFNKTDAGVENIDSIAKEVILYQGTINEYPAYTASGDDFEMFPIVVSNVVDASDDRFLAANTISVYVKEIASGKYFEYKEVDNLYLSDATSRVYDLRLNENGNYEVKFGNGVFGRRLVAGDDVVVYYILSDNQKGLVSKGAINGNKLFTYANQRFNSIYTDVTAEQDTTTFISSSNTASLILTNPNNSTLVGSAETVDQIRQNVPKVFSSQLRFVTNQDYQINLERALTNIVASLRVVDNNLYTTQYLQYFYDIMQDPTKVNRVLINQVSFADSCDFNNVNIFVVPRFTLSADNQYPDFLSSNFKNLIGELTESKKMLSHEVVPRDPVYMAFDIGFSNDTILDYSKISANSKLIVVRENTNRISKDTLQKRVSEAINNFFLSSNNTLGQAISLLQLTSQILSIDGVKSIRTESAGIKFAGISFVMWNPLYPDNDVSIVNQDITLPFYKFPYLYRPVSLVNSIEVIDE